MEDISEEWTILSRSSLPLRMYVIDRECTGRVVNVYGFSGDCYAVSSISVFASRVSPLGVPYTSRTLVA